jgi:hypothetical protein
MALTATKNDNGYVTMFFLLIPALSALISFVLSHWVPGLQFIPRPMFFGMALVTIPLLALSLASWRTASLAVRYLASRFGNMKPGFAPYLAE